MEHRHACLCAQQAFSLLRGNRLQACWAHRAVFQRSPGQRAAKKWQPSDSMSKFHVLSLLYASTLARGVYQQPKVNVVPRGTRKNRSSRALVVRVGLLFAALFVIGVFVWQGIAAHGAPDPLQAHTSATVASLDIGVLVFREGLECILVLAAVTASMTGSRRNYRKPVMSGAFIAFLATLVTWFVAAGIMKQLSENVPALHLQAATGLLAVIVLLVIMNWFFTKFTGAAGFG